MADHIIIDPADTVGVVLSPLAAGSVVGGVRLTEDIPAGHKFALTDIRRGEPVIKYGAPIGLAVRDIAAGSHVHTGELQTALSGAGDPVYRPSACVEPGSGGPLYFDGYDRGGRAGVRNDVFIIATVGCVNSLCRDLALRASASCPLPDGEYIPLTHPYGCSQLGGDLAVTGRTLAGLADSPNAFRVLFVSLGCENNNLSVFRPCLNERTMAKSRFLVSQDSADEFAEGLAILAGFAAEAAGEKRVRLPASRLTIGLKCGGSDGLSGITSNPLCGLFTERFTAAGGRAILTEVPEMFGAEEELFSRCADRELFDRAVKMDNDFRQYFMDHGQQISGNPSPGNKEGGITTLEEKSLGCVRKGGRARIVDVLTTGEAAAKAGLSLLSAPGNDIVSATALSSCGAAVILFTTGRGTPLGSVVPTLKIASNSALAQKKSGWIDFNAGRLTGGEAPEKVLSDLTELFLSVCSGRRTKNEINGSREIAIFKDGVTL